jgi:phospholipase/lecithinase/hemolysin
VNSHLPGTVQELASQVIRNIEQSIIYLADLGANQFMVVNSSDLKVLPGAIQFGQADVGGEFTDAFNRLLPVELAILGQDLGIEIGLYDHVAISDEIRSHPSQYGLTNLSDPCQPIHPVQPVCTAPDQYYFWDEYHPTTHVHHIIGEDMARFVQAHRVF